MKKYKKTYAILNLAEKHTTFLLGKTKVHVSFTGGQVTKKGVTPATFTTDNPIVQLAIENSKEFETGAVTLLSKYPTHGEVKIGMNPPVIIRPEASHPETQALASHPKTNPEEPHPETNPEEPHPETKPEEPHPETNPEEPHPETKPEDLHPASAEAAQELPKAEAIYAMVAAEAMPKQEKSGESNLEVIEVSCRDVAKQYLQEHYGENPAPLRTIANIQECAAKYGITFSFV